MSHFFQRVSMLAAAESGQDLIEYALAGALIAFAAIASMRNLATAILNVFTTMGTTITSAT